MIDPGLDRSRSASEMGTGSQRTREVPVPISEADRVTLGKTKGTGTSLRSGASPLCLAQSENETALMIDRRTMAVDN
jgi:hypothetical protein